MKKITTLLATLCLGVATALAGPVKADLASGVYEITPEGAQMMRVGQARAKVASQLMINDENTITRRYVDKNGNIVDLSVLLSEEKINEMVQFRDENGQVVTYPFSRLPYYAAYFTISLRKPDSPTYSNYINFTMCWPSMFIYEQIFTYDGDWDSSGQIPEDKRDYTPVPFNRLANDKDFTRRFVESNVIGTDIKKGENKFEFWTMLENALSGDGGYCTFEGQTAQTYLPNTDAQGTKTGSFLDFEGFNSENLSTDCVGRIYIQFQESNAQRVYRVDYHGPARIEGFEETLQTLPNFGDIHLFNAGVSGSEIMGDANPFTGTWGPYTLFYLATGDELIDWIVNQTATVFNKNVIENGGVKGDDDTKIDDNASMVMGYLFADPKYGNDTSLDPTEAEFKITVPILGSDNGETFLDIVPSSNSFVPYGASSNMQTIDYWSEEYGVQFVWKNYGDNIAANSRLGWGTTEGFCLDFNNYYKTQIKARSQGDVIYHYNPKDVQKTRVFRSVGTKEWGSGVANVIAEGAAKVSAANGVITVAAAEDANVAVYSLDGACVKSVKAVAGEVLNVAASKGVYVVVVNGASQKVIL